MGSQGSKATCKQVASVLGALGLHRLGCGRRGPSLKERRGSQLSEVATVFSADLQVSVPHVLR